MTSRVGAFEVAAVIKWLKGEPGVAIVCRLPGIDVVAIVTLIIGDEMTIVHSRRIRSVVT